MHADIIQKIKGVAKMEKLWLMLMVLMMIFTANCLAAEKNYLLVEAAYTVQAADTLQSITAEYMQKNTYGERELHEFVKGIRQFNEQLVTGSLHVGDVIRINYWVKK